MSVMNASLLLERNAFCRRHAFSRRKEVKGKKIKIHGAIINHVSVNSVDVKPDLKF